ncbi:PDZ domain-containing protein [Belliella sp. DSM 111904]|uniref:Tricorn protease homolog n=1 Tax=Belliella filtrata TaxID=2923435 RepID=A0ABS9V2Z2_9BACT|nr:S41 family peptidase [Belliella filtrata]MCH7410789.1 PDZ domain-containing protein [Belliella filtrata]
MKRLLLLILSLSPIASALAQLDASLMRHPDVSDTHIVFCYGDDIWLVAKEGGTAHRLTSPEGPEMYPKFSPDGNQIAFTANYNGNNDIYVMPSTGGIPKRLTYHGMSDLVLGWTPDGKSVLFSSGRESGKERFSQFYTVPVTGGHPSKLAVPYGEFGSFSPNGKSIAYTDRSRVNRNWKRYRGGTAPDITVFNLENLQTENITSNDANDELPMWIDDAIFYMSDNGPEGRNNLWKYDIKGKNHSQLTSFEDFDITFPSNSTKEIVFEAGGKLYLYNIASSRSKEIPVKVISDQKALMPILTNASDYMQSASISPDGKRVLVSARGDVFNLPASEGFITNETTTSGVAERYPSWSPDGRLLAYWSDASGEYQLHVKDLEKKSTKELTSFKKGFYYNIYWSPDSKKIVTINQAMEIMMIEINSGAAKVIDKGKYMFEGNLQGFEVNWSPDSRYVVYSMSKQNRATSEIYLYELASNKVSQITSGFYADNSPVFSRDGKYLFFTTNRNFDPLYSDIDNTFIYPNTTGIAVGTVAKSVPSLLTLKNDTQEVKKDGDDDKKKEDDKKDEGKVDKITFEVEGFEERLEMLDIEVGNIASLATTKDKLIYLRYPNSGSASGTTSKLEFYDFEEEESKTIMERVGSYQLSANGNKLLVSSRGQWGVIDPAPGKNIEDAVPTKDMKIAVVPAEEWKQIFHEVWRLERDYFYDSTMHGVDWDSMKTKYGNLVTQATSRRDVNSIIGNLIAELNASHTYVSGGSMESASSINVGYLGADFSFENGAYRIKKIIKGAPWDLEVRSPLQKPGVDIKEGDYILEINGQTLDNENSIYAALQGLANKTVQLTVNGSPNTSGARKVLVKSLSSEARLRNLAWINGFRERVEEATNGKIGYIFVPSTGVDGQNELFRQFYGQMNKEGFIIDERFNNGGQIPDRFIELLDRGPLAHWAVRDGEDWDWPPSGNFGPKVMLINGFSGSGGDAFPDYFRKRNLGPLIGTRTWGGLIGISGAPELIDGGSVTVPTFRMYDPNGEWFKEGHGVDPDIEVVEDFGSLAKGKDAQLEAAIKEVLRLLNSSEAYKRPNRPKYEER